MFADWSGTAKDPGEGNRYKNLRINNLAAYIQNLLSSRHYVKTRNLSNS